MTMVACQGRRCRRWVAPVLLVTAVVASACNSSESGSATPNSSASGSETTVAPVTTAPSSADPTDAGTNTEADVAGLFDIGGGRKMYLECWGEGSPTVVLVSGYGDTGRIWSVDAPELPRPHVLPTVAGFTRVCAYDRPGTVGFDVADASLRSRSDPVSQPRAPEDVVADLHALLAAAEVPGPYVLAGHSLGGAYVRLYAATYPDGIVGVVLIDVTNEYYRAGMTPEQWAPLAALMGTPPDLPGYPEVEQVDFDVVLDALERAVAAQPLPELPLAVLSRGSEDEEPPGLPPGVFDAQLDAGRAGQEQLAALVPDARHVIATDSGHYIHVEQPALVIEAIRQVVEGVRHPNTWYDLVSCCAP